MSPKTGSVSLCIRQSPFKMMIFRPVQPKIARRPPSPRKQLGPPWRLPSWTSCRPSPPKALLPPPTLLQMLRHRLNLLYSPSTSAMFSLRSMRGASHRVSSSYAANLLTRAHLLYIPSTCAASPQCTFAFCLSNLLSFDSRKFRTSFDLHLACAAFFRLAPSLD